MRKKALVCLLLLLTASVCFGQQVEWFEGSFEEAKQEAKIQDKTILINFFSGSG